MHDLEWLNVVLHLACSFSCPLGNRDAHVLEAVLHGVPDHLADKGEYFGTAARDFA